MTLKGKFRLIVALSTGGFLLIGAAGLALERSRLISVEKEQSKTLVELAYGIISEQHQLELDGKVTRQQAQQQAIQTVRAMRRGSDGYLWINDLRPVMVMHPTQPQLEGKDLIEYKDANGASIVMQMIAKVKTQGAGYVSYPWPRPGRGDAPVPKISYVMGFPPWGWVVGSGLYTDGVMSAWRTNALIAAVLFALSCLLLFLVVSSRISSSIFSRLDYVVDRMRAIGQAEADLNTPLNIPEASGFSRSSAGDEITVLP